jgi:Pentapeptide repeats (8 copies)
MKKLKDWQAADGESMQLNQPEIAKIKTTISEIIRSFPMPLVDYVLGYLCGPLTQTEFYQIIEHAVQTGKAPDFSNYDFKTHRVKFDLKETQASCLENAIFRNSLFARDTVFKNISLKGADFSGALMCGVIMVDVDFTGVILTDTNLSGAAMCIRSQSDKIDFSTSNLSGATIALITDEKNLKKPVVDLSKATIQRTKIYKTIVREQRGGDLRRYLLMMNPIYQGAAHEFKFSSVAHSIIFDIFTVLFRGTESVADPIEIEADQLEKKLASLPIRFTDDNIRITLLDFLACYAKSADPRLCTRIHSKELLKLISQLDRETKQAHIRLIDQLASFVNPDYKMDDAKKLSQFDDLLLKYNPLIVSKDDLLGGMLRTFTDFFGYPSFTDLVNEVCNTKDLRATLPSAPASPPQPPPSVGFAQSLLNFLGLVGRPSPPALKSPSAPRK